MSTIALIAIGYNRIESLMRLLESLRKADYGNDEIPLIISIDKSDSDMVEKAAKEFEWEHGKKEIRTFTENQGLRKHILSCGDYLEKYDAVFIFEDDIVVSPYFYQYGKSCIDHYRDNENIAGISLYSIKWNPNANFPFEPVKTQYDTYFLQYAQSWGQIWIRNRFKEFIAWYKENEDFFEKERNKDIPLNLYTWGKNSWLKYHIAYCALKNKYFVYPYYSYTTAFMENATHSATDVTRFQTEMMINNKRSYQLADFNNNAAFYDTFFENIQVKVHLDKDLNAKVLLDLYGRRELTGQEHYMISTQVLPFEVKREYALQLRPIELNVYMNIEGKGIYVYDISVKRKITKKEKRNQIVRKWDYFMKERFLMWDEIIPLCCRKVENLFRIMMKRFKSKKKAI